MMLIELGTPLSAKQVRGLRVGDRLSLTGTVFTMRDQATMRLLGILRRGEDPPVDISGSVVYHAGPAIDLSGGSPKLVSIGPTTSARMNPIMPELMERTGIRLVIGKGGMDGRVLAAMARTGCAYASAIGGCSVLYTRSVTAIRRIVWEEMGPEAIHELQVERMMPLMVTMDSHGGSLHGLVEEGARQRLGEILGSGHADADAGAQGQI